MSPEQNISRQEETIAAVCNKLASLAAHRLDRVSENSVFIGDPDYGLNITLYEAKDSFSITAQGESKTYNMVCSHGTYFVIYGSKGAVYYGDVVDSIKDQDSETISEEGKVLDYSFPMRQLTAEQFAITFAPQCYDILSIVEANARYG